MIEYLPGSNVTVVPEELPSNDAGVGLLPSTVIVKSDGLALPPPSLITLLVTTISPVVTGGGDAEYVLVITHCFVCPALTEPGTAIRTTRSVIWHRIFSDRISARFQRYSSSRRASIK